MPSPSNASWYKGDMLVKFDWVLEDWMLEDAAGLKRLEDAAWLEGVRKV